MKRTKQILALSIIMIVLGSFLAGMFHSSMFSVKIKEIEFETERGTLNGLLYMPKDAGADSRRPVIVTTHGYLNTKEMQDAPAIEMSRRGYIVLALDMYDHGDSRWKEDIKVGEQFGTFWMYSQLDAANYMAEQDFTLKDEKGNAYVAVSGHSMGGFSTLVALYMDEMASLQRGTRNIHAGISVGADFSYAAAIAPQEDYIAAFGDRTVGMIAGKYDEFFFNKSDEEKTEAEKAVAGTVTRKDFAGTASGKMFLGLEGSAAAEAGKFYDVESGDLTLEGNAVRESQTGSHVIYTPNQTHPWNHFSKTTTGNLIEFYQTAFADVVTSDMVKADLSADSQIWFFKELFNLVSLIGFFLLVLPVLTLLLKLPFLKESVTEETAPVATPRTGAQKAAFWICIAVSTLYPAVFFNTFMDKQEKGLVILFVLSILACGAGILFSVYYFMKQKKGQGIAMTAAAAVSLVCLLVFKFAGNVLPLSGFFSEPTTNQIAYWAISSGLIALVILLMFYGISKKNLGAQAKDYGVRLNGKAIIASLSTAAAALVILYLVLFAVQAIFGVDFRIWTLAVRTFKPEHILAALRYLPFFFLFYLINTTAVNANTRGRKYGTLIGVALNIGGLLLWIMLQYGLDFTRGVAMFPDQALNGILLFATVPCLGIAAVFARKIFEKTNNVWLGAFFNSMLFTLITAANTALFWNMK